MNADSTPVKRPAGPVPSDNPGANETVPGKVSLSVDVKPPR